MKNILFIILVLILSLLSCSDGYNDLKFGSIKMVLYVADNASMPDGSVSSYSINPNTGELKHVNTLPNYGAFCVRVDPTNRFVYVSNKDHGTLSGYSINHDDGSLTEISGSPYVLLGADPRTFSIHPNGKFIYVSGNYGGTASIKAFGINGSTGGLTELAGSPYDAFTYSISNCISPGGQYLYGSEGSGATGRCIRWYPVNSITGVLTESVSTANNVSTGGDPFVFIEPLGRFVYSNSSDGLECYSVNSSTGVLTEESVVPSTGTDTRYLAFDPDGKFAYAVSFENHIIYTYSINSSTGALSEIPGSQLSTGNFPADVVVDPTGRFVYVANYGGHSISIYTVDSSSGTLTNIGTVVTGASTNPYSLDIGILP